MMKAIAIGIGVSMFSLSQKKAPDEDNQTKTIGLVFVAMYLVCDSFTSQWQDRIFKKHKIDQFQMMFGVNCFSILFTVGSLLWVSMSFTQERLSGFSQHPLQALKFSSYFDWCFCYYAIVALFPRVILKV